MMSPLVADLLRRAAEAGVVVRVEAGLLTCYAPAGAEAAAVMAQIGRYRVDVLEALRPTGRPPRCPRHLVLLNAAGVCPRCDPQAAGVVVPEWAMLPDPGGRANDAGGRHRRRAA